MYKSSFILVGSNNFWYASFPNTSLESAKKEARKILRNYRDYEDPESGYSPERPSQIFIYKTAGSALKVI